MQDQQLRKTLSSSQLLAIGLGAVVGWSWVVYGGLWSTAGGSMGGIIAFAITGILCSLIGVVYAELTSAYPKVGGDVVFAFEGIGFKSSLVTMWALLVFWIGLTMIETMMIPVIMTRLGIPIPKAWPLYEVAGDMVYGSYILVSLGFNVFFAFINTRGVEVSGRAQTIAVYILLSAAVFLFFSGITLGDVKNMEPLFTDAKGFTMVFLMLPGFMAGFNAIPQAAEEAKVSTKMMGYMVVATVWAATIFYTMIILGTSFAAPFEVRSAKGLVVLDSMIHIYGDSQIVNIFVAFASLMGMLTSWNACYIAYSRMCIGLARAKMLPEFMARLDPKHGTPVNGVISLCVVSSLVVFFGANQAIYVGILNVFSFWLLIAWVLVAWAFLRLQKLRPDLERPYRVKHPKLIGWSALIFSVCYIGLYFPFGAYGLMPLEWVGVGAIIIVALVTYFCWNLRGGAVSDEERRRLFGISSI